MEVNTTLFAIVAAVTSAAALGVALSRSVIRSAVWLLLTLVGVAFVYFLLGADFLGATQLIVYVGGTMVLIVFGVMLTSGGPFAEIPAKPAVWVGGGVMAVALFALLAYVSLKLAIPDTPGDLPGVGPLGLAFLGSTGDNTSYLLPFELLSVHLLVVLIAAAYLARAKKKAVPA